MFGLVLVVLRGIGSGLSRVIRVSVYNVYVVIPTHCTGSPGIGAFVSELWSAGIGRVYNSHHDLEIVGIRNRTSLFVCMFLLLWGLHLHSPVSPGRQYEVSNRCFR
jgi:hypothetical protein